MIRFTFIICARNNENIIDACISSVKELNKGSDWIFNITVVDDFSTDNTVSVIRENHPDINIIKMPQNFGPSICRNAVWKSSEPSDYFVFMDSDITLDNHFLINIMKYHIDVSGGKLIYPDGKINSAGGKISLTGFGNDIGDKEDSGYNENSQVMYLCSAAMVVSSDVIDKIGLFDETYFYGNEDTDFGWRANLAGCNVKYVASAKAVHAKSQTVKSNMGQIYFHATKNRFITMLKNYGFLRMIVFCPIHFLISMADILLRDYKKEKIKAWFWILSHLDGIFDKRKKVQKLRKVSDMNLKFEGLLW